MNAGDEPQGAALRNGHGGGHGDWRPVGDTQGTLTVGSHGDGTVPGLFWCNSAEIWLPVRMAKRIILSLSVLCCCVIKQ